MGKRKGGNSGQNGTPRRVGASTSYRRPGLRPDAETVLLPSLGDRHSSGTEPGENGRLASAAPAPAKRAVPGPVDGEPPAGRNREAAGSVLAGVARSAAERGAVPEPGSVSPSRRRTWVSRAVLLIIMAVQAFLALRMQNTAFEDEALYLYAGHMELGHLLHGAALQGSYAAYFSGAPVLYPVLGAILNEVGGLPAARGLGTAAMLATTGLLYSMTRRLFNERVGLSAALLFAVTESAIFLANFATYDAPALFLLAAAAWIAVRTAGSRWPLYLLAAPVAALAVATKYAALLFVPTIALLPALAGLPRLGRRALVAPAALAMSVAALLLGALYLAGPRYLAAIQTTTTSRALGTSPVTTVLRDSALWGGPLFVIAVYGTVAYARRATTEPGERIAPAGGTLRRVALGAVLTGTALLAPAMQVRLHTIVSLQKHIGFGLFFAAPMAGAGFARIVGDHFRRAQLAVALWGTCLVLGMSQASSLYGGWPNSTAFIAAFSHYLKPGAHYLVEEPEIPIYYLMGRAGSQPRQYTSTYFITYRDKQGQTLTGIPGFQAAIRDGYFHAVVYQDAVTPAVDRALATALTHSTSYQLARVVPNRDSSGPGAWYIWVKVPTPSPQHGVSAPRHTARRRHAPQRGQHAAAAATAVGGAGKGRTTGD